MKNLKLNILLLAPALFMQGCATHGNEKKIKLDDKKPELQQCVEQAAILVKLNKSYEKQYNTLYNLINESKIYASTYKETSGAVNYTIAPLIEYSINNTCNDISQSLIKEFKSRFDGSGLISGSQK